MVKFFPVTLPCRGNSITSKYDGLRLSGNKTSIVMASENIINLKFPFFFKIRVVQMSDVQLNKFFFFERSENFEFRLLSNFAFDILGLMNSLSKAIKLS